MGRLTQVFAGSSNGVANLSYDWDTAGNLTDRGDLNAAWQAEHFCYDALNRLTASAPSGTCTGGVSLAYDAAGNITSKSDVGTYAYAGASPHAVTAVTGTVNGVVNPSFAYDTDGAMTAGAGRTVSYTGFNMTKVVSEGATSETLSYDTEHARVRQVTLVGGVSTNTVYLNDPGANVMTEVSRTGTGATQWKSYILADGHIVAQRLTNSGTSPQMRYFVLDHLGSVSVVTDETGAVVSGGRQSYDAWGKERNLDGSADTTCSLPAQSATTRGFTSQEEIPAVYLVNFNARLYDPQLGRFMSADSVVQNPYDAQSLNRYTYVVNNPLSETDPTGNCHGLLECVGDGMVDASFPLMAIRPLLRTYPEIGSVLEIAASIACYSPICGALVAGEIGGITSGDVGAGFKAFAISYAEGLAMENININTDTPLGVMENAGAHGFIGGLVSMAGGGRFGSGFLAASFGSLAGSVLPSPGGIGGAIESAVLGGVGSMLGGGKFADGAATGAFEYVIADIATSSSDDTTVTALRAGGIAGIHGTGTMLSSATGFQTQDEAAQAAYTAAKAFEDFSKNEFGGVIFTIKNADGLVTGYGYTLYRGDDSGVSFNFRSDMVDWWHSHPSEPELRVYTTLNSANEFLSHQLGGDIDELKFMAHQLGFTPGSYLQTPAGEIRFFPDAVTNARDYRVVSSGGSQ
jgi:RHS repeat-associated protein